MNVIKEIEKINEAELQHGLSLEASWHWQYRKSAWIFAGGLAYELCEGDVLCVFSQCVARGHGGDPLLAVPPCRWGEIEDIHLARDEVTGKSKGFAFIKYERFESAVLAIDNFNGIKVRPRGAGRGPRGGARTV